MKEHTTRNQNSAAMAVVSEVDHELVQLILQLEQEMTDLRRRYAHDLHGSKGLLANLLARRPQLAACLENKDGDNL